jgi:hypothetical protein
MKCSVEKNVEIVQNINTLVRSKMRVFSSFVLFCLVQSHVWDTKRSHTYMYKRNPFLTHDFAGGLFSNVLYEEDFQKYSISVPSHWRLPSMVAPSQQMKGGVAGFSGYSQLTSSDRSLKYMVQGQDIFLNTVNSISGRTHCNLHGVPSRDSYSGLS